VSHLDTVCSAVCSVAAPRQSLAKLNSATLAQNRTLIGDATRNWTLNAACVEYAKALLVLSARQFNPVIPINLAIMVSHVLSVPVVKLRRGPEVRLVIAEPQSNEQTLADPALIRLLATARAANAAMLAARDQSVADAAKTLGYTNNYFTLLLRLATLAPSIVQVIIEGRQLPSLTRQRLAKITNLPLDWNKQRRMLGFA
jgi:hypothetical protein